MNGEQYNKYLETRIEQCEYSAESWRNSKKDNAEIFTNGEITAFKEALNKFKEVDSYIKELEDERNKLQEKIQELNDKHLEHLVNDEKLRILEELQRRSIGH